MPGFPPYRLAAVLLGFLPTAASREAPPLVLVSWSEMREAPALESWLREALAEPLLVVRQHLPTDPLPRSSTGLVLLGYEETWIRERAEEGRLLSCEPGPESSAFAAGFGIALCLETWTLGLAGGSAGAAAEVPPRAWSDLDAPSVARRVHLRLPAPGAPELRVLEFLARRKAVRGEDLSLLRFGSFDDGTLHSPGASWRSLFARLGPGGLCLAPVREMEGPGRDPEGPTPLVLQEGLIALTLGLAFGEGTSAEWQRRFREVLQGEPWSARCEQLDLEPLDGVRGKVAAWIAGSGVGRVSVPPEGGAALRAELLRRYPVLGEDPGGGLDDAWVSLFDMVALVVCFGVLVFVGWLMRQKSF